MDTTHEQQLWESFQQAYDLTLTQRLLFEQYAQMLVEWNEKVNLTAITQLQGILNDHFCDSLALKNAMDLSLIHTIADIGSGAGFPSVPLALLFEHLQIVIIEVSGKRIEFLHALAEKLGIASRIMICQVDWRTFLRTTSYDIDLFVTRAALKPMELVRVFSPEYHYQNAGLVYWAAISWQPMIKEEPYITKEFLYRCGDKKRKLVFLKNVR